MINQVTSNAISCEQLSRGEMISWINDSLKINIGQIQNLGTGAVFCQLLDMIYPGKVPLNKVNWKAKFEYEYVYNFKILQQTFSKLTIMKPIEVEKLIKCKYQDNLEFAQWMKKFYDANCTAQDYEALVRRGNVEIDFTFIEKVRTSSLSKDSVSKNNVPQPQGGIPVPSISSNVPKSNFAQGGINISGNGGTLIKNNSTSNLSVNQENESVDRSSCQNEKNPQFDAIQTERDYYFSKLKDIDHLLDVCRDSTVDTLVTKIREILFAKPEKIVLVFDDGSVKVNFKEEQSLLNNEEFELFNHQNQTQEDKDDLLLLDKENHDGLFDDNINTRSNISGIMNQSRINSNIELINQRDFEIKGSKIYENPIVTMAQSNISEIGQQNLHNSKLLIKLDTFNLENDSMLIQDHENLMSSN